jgi:hypothetical protein
MQAATIAHQAAARANRHQLAFGINPILLTHDSFAPTSLNPDRLEDRIHRIGVEARLEFGEQFARHGRNIHLMFPLPIDNWKLDLFEVRGRLVTNILQAIPDQELFETTNR